jgi:Tetratricopeptide repeat/NB-ARC domain
VSNPSPALHRTIVGVDVARFTDPGRTTIHHTAIRDGLLGVLTEGFANAGVDLPGDHCLMNDTGDGKIIVITPDVPKIKLATEFPDGLVKALRRYNSVHAVEAKMQLRVALHSGEVFQDGNEISGRAVITAFRVLDATEPKTELRQSGGLLALIASNHFYEEVIQEDPGAEPGSYRQIHFSVKSYSGSLWLRVFDVPVTLSRSESPPVGVPTIWGNVPMRNKIFTGRTELLGDLDRLTTDGATVLLTSALHGMGGIGKTQAALEYIYRRLDRYDIVWWIQAAQPAQIRASLVQLAQQLGLPGSAEASTAVPAVLESLRLGQPYRRWILVFDAAESPAVVREYLPANGPGEVLITSRNPNWHGIAQPLEVKLFSGKESVELMRRRGLNADDADAGQLAEKLGDLPLAIEQAAAWLAQSAMPVEEYVRLFEEKVEEILDVSVPTEYEVSVGAVWNVSFDQLQSQNPAAYQILQVCAFLAPEPISRNLFTGYRGTTGSAELTEALRDPLLLGRAFLDINKYSLAKVDQHGHALLLHRLVQSVLRNRMPRKTWDEMHHLAHLVLANYDPDNPTRSDTWPLYREVLPHVALSGLIQCDDAYVRQLITNLIHYLFCWGDHEQAAGLAQQARDRWSERSGQTNPYALRAATHLGWSLWALGRFTESAAVNQQTLALHQQTSDEDAIKDAISAELLAAAHLRYRGDFIAARDAEERIYQKARESFGEDDPVTLKSAHELAVTVRLCGDYHRAFLLDSRNYLRRKEDLGPDSVDTLSSLSAMILDKRELGDYRYARTEQEKVADRFRGIFGEDRADTLSRLADLAVARRKDGDHDGALELSAQALKLYTQRYGNGHPNAMAGAVGHSIDLRYAKHLDSASDLGAEILEQYREKLGEQHPHTLCARINLAVTLRLLGDADLAQQYDARAHERLRAQFGADHPYVIACTINLASDLAALGQTDQALTFGHDALHRAKRVLSEDHPTTLAAAHNLAIDRNVAADTGARVDCDIDPLPM